MLLCARLLYLRCGHLRWPSVFRPVQSSVSTPYAQDARLVNALASGSNGSEEKVQSVQATCLRYHNLNATVVVPASSTNPSNSTTCSTALRHGLQPPSHLQERVLSIALCNTAKHRKVGAPNPIAGRVASGSPRNRLLTAQIHASGRLSQRDPAVLCPIHLRETNALRCAKPYRRAPTPRHLDDAAKAELHQSRREYRP